MTFNYWVIGLPSHQPGVAHSVRLKHKAAPGQTLTYEDIDETYRIVGFEEGNAGNWGVLRVQRLIP